MKEAEFHNINRINIKEFLDVYHPTIKFFSKHEPILNPSEDIHRIGIILSGTAYLATINSDFQKRILDYYEAYDVFYHHII